MEKEALGGVQTLDRALDIVELLCENPAGLGVSEIGRRLDLNKSTVYRLAEALDQRGYVEKPLGAPLYKPGLKLVELAAHRMMHLELKTEAAVFLRQLALKVNRSVHLAILSGHEGVYIDKVEPLASLRMYSQIGLRIPLHCTALGKALVSDLSNHELDVLIKKMDFKVCAPNTKVTKQEFLDSVHLGQKRGWFFDDQEYEEEIRCIAIPLRDYTGKIIAAVSTSGDLKQALPDQDEAHAEIIRESVKLIEKRLGFFEKNHEA